MNIKHIILENRVVNFFRLLPLMLSEYITFSKGNARSNNSKNKEKELTEILMLSHAIEKGFSLPNLRKSFGIEKAQRLTTLIKKYIAKHGFDNSLIVPISVLRQYLRYHKENGIKNSSLQNIEDNIDIFIGISRLNLNSFNEGGTFDKTKDEMLSLSQSNFKILAEGRYSIRNYESTPINIEDVNEAIQIASKSPSACNRQSYRVHIFEGTDKMKLLNMQGGAKSFMNTVDKVILITADLNRYYSLEMHLGYVDGSLFAMSLIYALTYKGIGSIPLTLGIRSNVLNNIKKNFNIPQNEIPVIMIAIGNYKDKFKVAKSHRNPIESFTTYHK